MTAVGAKESDMAHSTGDDGVAVLTVGDGERFNALSSRQWRALEDSARSLAENSAIRAVVVRGTGSTFCSGSDLREWQDAGSADVNGSFAVIEAALQAIEAIPVPTVALVQGVATGAGCQLALACDLQVLESSARIGMPIARLGLLIPPSFANRMSLRIGPSRAKDLLYGGRLLTAAEALAMGLVTTVVAAGLGAKEVAQLTETWRPLSQASLRASKVAVNLGLAPVEVAGRTLPHGAAADPEEFSHRVRHFLRRKHP